MTVDADEEVIDIGAAAPVLEFLQIVPECLVVTANTTGHSPDRRGALVKAAHTFSFVGYYSRAREV